MKSYVLQNKKEVASPSRYQQQSRYTNFDILTPDYNRTLEHRGAATMMDFNKTRNFDGVPDASQSVRHSKKNTIGKLEPINYDIK